ncbi:hypothetical protein KSS87_001876, partial [Heliosperma pusillum]
TSTPTTTVTTVHVHVYVHHPSLFPQPPSSTIHPRNLHNHSPNLFKKNTTKEKQKRPNLKKKNRRKKKAAQVVCGGKESVGRKKEGCGRWLAAAAKTGQGRRQRGRDGDSGAGAAIAGQKRRHRGRGGDGGAGGGLRDKWLTSTWIVPAMKVAIPQQSWMPSLT